MKIVRIDYETTKREVEAIRSEALRGNCTIAEILGFPRGIAVCLWEKTETERNEK